MNEKLKELRIWFSAVILVTLFLPWVKITSEAEVMGYSSDASVSFSGLKMMLGTYLGWLIFLVAIALLVMELVPQIGLQPKVFYLLGSFLGIVATVFGLLLSKGLYGISAGNDDASVTVKLSPQIGFWITILMYAAIFIYTLIKDYALSKETLQSKGLKGAFSEIAGNVTSDISEQAAKMQSGELAESIKGGVSQLAGSVSEAGADKGKIKCPNCGADLPAGKKFCAKCGGKIVAAESSDPKTGTGSAAPSKNMTVREYIAKQKNIVCNQCGTKVPAGTKFCPDCGGQIEFLYMPEVCACGAKLMTGKKFCPDCGKEIVGKKLKVVCDKCGADLIFGKKFCVECGEKTEE